MNYSITSAPVVCGDVVIVGSAISDQPRLREAPPRHVRGFDARTGELLWTFHTIPQPGEFGHETWEDGSWRYTGNTNVWTLMSADEELGYVYLPVGNATGEVLAEVPLPGRAIGAPMSYIVEGTQYIALTVQGNPPRLVALAVN